MSMLARYKKGGGIIELVKLIEDSAEPKRSQLLKMVRDEDPEFAARVDARIFSFDKLSALPEAYIAEIIATSAPKFVALALVGSAPDFVALCEKCLGKNFAEYKSEKAAFVSAAPAPGQVEAARRKITSEARKLEAAGKIKLPASEDKNPPGFAGAPPPAGGTASSFAQGTPQSPNSTGGDTDLPNIQSFQLEPAPPGLSGERFETFLKTMLGK